MAPFVPSPRRNLGRESSEDPNNQWDSDVPSPALMSRNDSKASSTHSVSTRHLKPVKGFQDRDDFHILLFASFCLCFNAGFINTLTMSSFLELSTAHVTGLVARTSIALADADFGYVYLPAVTFLFFLVGSILSGFTISYDTFYMGRGYGRNLILIASLQGLALIIHQWRAIPSTGRHEFIWACALAMGCQNGLTSKYSGNTLRTTHVTGPTTDLGIALGHMLKGRWEDLWKVKLHTTAIIGYLLGGVGGRLGYVSFQEMALLFNITLLLVLGLMHLTYLSCHEKISIIKVAASRHDINVHHIHPSRYRAGSSTASRSSLLLPPSIPLRSMSYPPVSMDVGLAHHQGEKEGGKEVGKEDVSSADLEAGGVSSSKSVEGEGGREGGRMGRAYSFPAAMPSMDSALTHMANEDEEHYQRRLKNLEEEERERRRRERERGRKSMLSFGGMVQRLGSSLQRREESVVKQDEEEEEEEVKEELSSIAFAPRGLERGEVEEEGVDSDSENDYMEAEEDADFDVYSNLDVAADIQEEGEKGEWEEGEEDEGRDLGEGGEEKDAEGWRK